MNAQQRLAQLNTEVEDKTAKITELEADYETKVRAGHDAEADKILTKINALRADINAAEARRPVIEQMVQEEQKAAKEAEAVRLSEVADTLRESLMLRIVELQKIEVELAKALLTHEETWQWQSACYTAIVAGGNPSVQPLPAWSDHRFHTKVAEFAGHVGAANGYVLNIRSSLERAEAARRAAPIHREPTPEVIEARKKLEHDLSIGAFGALHVR
jgi:hypothetical protein